MITHQSIGRLEDRFEGTENYDRHAVANQNLTFPLMPERTIIEFTFVQLHMQIRIQKVVEHAISALVFQPSCCAEYSLNPSGVGWENKKHFNDDHEKLVLFTMKIPNFLASIGLCVEGVVRSTWEIII